MLNILPPEIIIAIFARLPLNSLRNIPLVSKHWNDFLIANENSFYHNAALLHGYAASSGVTIEEGAAEFSKRTLGGADSWKTFCRKRLYIEKSWSGKAPTSTKVYESTDTRVHRIKVDEKNGLLITTNTNAGLIVTSLETGEKLWSLPRSYVRPYAHLEYSQGFMVFDNLDGSKEVWRRVWDFPSFTTPEDLDRFDAVNDNNQAVIPAARPTQAQIDAGNQLPGTFGAPPGVPGFVGIDGGMFGEFPPIPTGSDKFKGHFRPWAKLRMPNDDFGRAFRLGDNCILGVAAMGNVYLWDVRTGVLVQTIREIQKPVKAGLFPQSTEGQDAAAAVEEGYLGDIVTEWQDEDDLLGEINYIELNDEFVFLCGDAALRIYDRREGGKCVLHMLCGGMVGKAWFTMGEFDLNYSSLMGTREEALKGQDLQYHPVMEGCPGHGYYDDEFTAVHVSSCGSHLAIMTSNSRLILLPYFKRCLSSAQARLPIHEVAIEVVIGDTIWDNVINQDAFRYLAFNRGNIGVATKNGIYVVQPNWDGLCREDLAAYDTSERTRWEDFSKNVLCILRIPQFWEEENFGTVSCLQLSETGLFTVWDPTDLPGGIQRQIHLNKKTVVSIDFWDKETVESGVEGMS